MLTSLITIFSSSFMLALSGALMPGPVLTVTVSESLRRGAIAGPIIILGHGVLELLLIIILFTGFGSFLAREDVFTAISLIGGSILIWMAYSMFKELPSLTLNMDVHNTKPKNLFLSGILLSVANPYWIIWWATIGLGYIMFADQFGLIGIFTFFLGHILADLAWYSFISYSVAKGRHLFSDNLYRLLIGGCAVFLLLMATFYIYKGLAKHLF